MNKKRRFSVLILLPASLVFLILLGICSYVLITAITVSPPAYEEVPGSTINSQDLIREAYHAIPKPLSRSSVQKKDRRPKIAIIIDDLGHDSDLAFSFLKLSLELSFSILPSAPFTDIIVREANRRGREIILHQPMEPRDYPAVNPGRGALLLSMNERDILQILDRNLREIRGARGINNHMGSSFTENRAKMRIILQDLKNRGLFYVDSRTTLRTVGFEQAKKIGLPATERTVFLDNNPNSQAIAVQVERLLDLAKSLGTAVGIGHPYNETLESLEKYQNRLKGEFDVVPVSELVR